MTDVATRNEWRCFHCDEVFTDTHSAKLHFGMDQCSDPACKIKMGAEKSLLVALRTAENELADAWAAIHNESTESAKAYYAQQSRHGDQLRAAEELGFERGMRDTQNERDELRAEVDRLQNLIRENGTPRFNEVCRRAEAAEAEVKRLREALAKLESANEALCAVRSQAAYDQMMADSCAGELHDLDVARAAARKALTSAGEQTNAG